MYCEVILNFGSVLVKLPDQWAAHLLSDGIANSVQTDETSKLYGLRS